MKKRLDIEIEELIKFLKKNHEIPKYNNILITIDKQNLENIDGFYKTIIYKKEMFLLKDFYPLFDNLLTKRYSWINLHCAGIYNDSLIFTIELPDSFSSISSNNININYSGPAYHPKKMMPVWDFAFFYEIK